ncbi:MAG: hypothetical protein KGZ53_05515 [Peptococcaceae bacterium]|nr:hypothetical protein [Peptococcaceae bacterium]
MRPIFTTLNSYNISELLAAAVGRVIYVAPGLTQDISRSVISVNKRLGPEAVTVVLV